MALHAQPECGRFAFDEDLRLQADGTDAWTGQVSPAWNIGRHPNGGYLAALAGRALQHALAGHPDPLSMTVHYLKPGLSDQPCRIEVQVLRRGRQLSTARATLLQDGVARLEVLAAFGALAEAGEPVAGPALSLDPPDLPAPDACAGRSSDAQGVSLAILRRVDVRLHPGQAEPGAAGRAEVSGWIRFRDGRDPDTLACVLFADAFPPPVFGLLGAVGWVPTVELTVQVRAKPASGWMRGRFVSHDLADGRLVEDGALWDAEGRLIVQSRQLALLRQPVAG